MTEKPNLWRRVLGAFAGSPAPLPDVVTPRPMPDSPIDTVPVTPAPPSLVGESSSQMPIVAASDPSLLPPEPIQHVDWAPPPRAVPDGRPRDVGWYLTLDDGREVELVRLALVGRHPETAPEEPGAALVQIGGDGQSVSKTHLCVGVDDDGAFLIDRGSTNGTALVSTSGRLEPLSPGIRSRVQPGQRVSLGDRWLVVNRH